jgi:hypothetical protein
MPGDSIASGKSSIGSPSPRQNRLRTKRLVTVDHLHVRKAKQIAAQDSSLPEQGKFVL